MNLFDYTYDLVRQIPNGYISSYGAIAEALGDKIASRAVGRMMNQNPNADNMPCYKIVHSDGKLGGFGLGIDDKIRRLKMDDVFVKDGKINDFENKYFTKFRTDFPLKKLREEQIDLSKKIILKDSFSKIETVGGIDIAYPSSEFEKACGAYVILDYQTKEIIEKKVIFEKTNFPYISTYLFYREFPIIKKLFEIIKEKPSIMIFDGNGILHPYRIGIASQAGVLLDIPSIGVAKNLLYGSIEESFVKIDNEIRGCAGTFSNKITKPIFISPGHKISLDKSIEVVRNLCKYKSPEPIRLAHQFANNMLRNRS